MANALSVRWGSLRMAKKKVADLLVDVLAEAGVRQICGVSSGSLNGITDGAQELLGWFGGYGS
jgi:hypothetical protein